MINKNTTVQELRQKFRAKVYVTHIRRYELFNLVTRKIEDRFLTEKEALEQLSFFDYSYGLKNTGGETIVEIESPNGRYYMANAICSKKDCYDKKIGVKICIEQISIQIAEYLAGC